MTTGLITHNDYLLHDNGPFHPERPNRLRAIWEALHTAGLWDRLDHLAPREATESEVLAVHDPRYVNAVRRIAEQGGGALDADTPIGAESYRVALLSAGAALVGLEALLDGTHSNVFVASRPPGHHARPNQGMGFCLFNNAAIAARAALARGLGRVFILDWDVHHGNGTQDAFYDDGQVFFLSLHQTNFYPFTGYEDETGEGEGEGTNLNLPLLAGRQNRHYLELIEGVVRDAVRAFEPELIILCAGQDIHENDPLGGMRVTGPCFGTMTRRVLDVAAEVCAGRLLVCLEGGYDLDGLSEGVNAIIAAMLGDAEGSPA